MLDNSLTQQLLITSVNLFLLILSFYKIVNNKNFHFPFINVFIIVNIIACFFELIISLTTHRMIVPNIGLLYILHNGYNCAAIIAAGCWFLNSVQITRSKIFSNKLLLCAIMAPLIVIICFTLTTSLHELVFFIDDVGQYHRGNLFIPFFSIPGIYLIIALCSYVYADFNKEIYVFKNLNKIASVYTLLLLLFMFLQVETTGKISVINSAAAVISLLIHEDLLQKEITIDTLTKLNNRNAFNEYLLKILKHRNNSTYHAIMLDLDYFKKINDEYGHVEGDRALITVAKALRYAFVDNSFYGRLGGDEFVAICCDWDETKLQTVESTLNDNIKKILIEENAKYTFTISTGICLISDDMQTIPDVIKEADDKLYARKKEKKIAINKTFRL